MISDHSDLLNLYRQLYVHNFDFQNLVEWKRRKQHSTRVGKDEMKKIVRDLCKKVRSRLRAIGRERVRHPDRKRLPRTDVRVMAQNAIRRFIDGQYSDLDKPENESNPSQIIVLSSQDEHSCEDHEMMHREVITKEKENKTYSKRNHKRRLNKKHRKTDPVTQNKHKEDLQNERDKKTNPSTMPLWECKNRSSEKMSRLSRDKIKKRRRSSVHHHEQNHSSSRSDDRKRRRSAEMFVEQHQIANPVSDIYRQRKGKRTKLGFLNFLEKEHISRNMVIEHVKETNVEFSNEQSGKTDDRFDNGVIVVDGDISNPQISDSFGGSHVKMSASRQNAFTGIQSATKHAENGTKRQLPSNCPSVDLENETADTTVPDITVSSAQSYVSTSRQPRSFTDIGFHDGPESNMYDPKNPTDSTLTLSGPFSESDRNRTAVSANEPFDEHGSYRFYCKVMIDFAICLFKLFSFNVGQRWIQGRNGKVIFSHLVPL